MEDGSMHGSALSEDVVPVCFGKCIVGESVARRRKRLA